MIPVTKTFLPPKKEYIHYLDEIWQSNQIANGGSLHKKLTESLKSFLGVDHVIPTANGTLPLQIALKALAGNGEVITTPFSYVATTSSIVWENCTPVFVDIHPEYLTIDETKIEEAITKRTTAILATHVFGNPCNVEAIQQIADKYQIKVIYDAAHCFGVKYNGASIFNYGDIITCSFHATKLFHTGEGGAMFCKDLELYKELFYRHNFGHDGPEKIQGLGINAKMSELQAAMGLAVFPHLPKLIEKRKSVIKEYDSLLDFSKIRRPILRENTDWNYSYYPVIFESEEILLKIVKELNNKDIFPRRYFYPSLSNLPFITMQKMLISDNISKRILCLPLYHDLVKEKVSQICTLINND
ncbi:DegT/DnrJ/EryC1/StrS family aminotransferase [Pontixanthobacter gangjinensis]|uniref:DegT/DnrJ/EryC1/StrS family aminotransferase n=1 Tax=Christiangramia aestuarii TaxID=1028746 RepID=A0A7M3SWU9_9FLAO|nr:DegT/DnrJ/EryC1/StrS family aminotransferase [Christiangramia aestuarii]MUP41080.1 DegT/DnrJ/EryC1/StrS family aminotransferase [Christiangramia aestuarii]